MLITANITFEHLCKAVIGEFTGDTLVVDRSSGGKKLYSKEQYLERINAFAASLSGKLSKYPHGTWVGFCCKNTADWIAVLFAVTKCGCAPVLLNSEWSSEQINAYSKKLSMPVVIDDDAARANELTAEAVLLYPQDLIQPDTAASGVSGEWADKLAFVTSGTTSQPKLYIFSAESLLRETISVAEMPLLYEVLPMERLKRFLQVLPLRHCFGLGTLLILWRIGATAVFPENLGILTLVQAIREEGINCIASVPAVWKGLMSIVRIKTKTAEITPETFSAVYGDTFVTGICAGARTEERLQQDFKGLPFTMMNGWGMTEVGIALIGPFGAYKNSKYTGELVPAAAYQMRVLLPDGSIAEQGTGELLINGDCLYCESVTDAAIIPRSGEWFHTGDIFEIDETHFLFHGRCKSVMIGESGENLYPEELEEQFSSVIPDAVPFCIVGDQERPVLFLDGSVLQDADAETLTGAIRAHNSTLLPSYRLTQIILTTQPILRTSKGEPARFRLMDEFRKAPDAYKQIILQKGLS